MDWVTIGGLLSSLGVVELIKYWLSRKSQKRKEEASASQEEATAEQMKVQVKQDEWELYKDMLNTLQDGLMKKDEIIANKDRIIEQKDARYIEQTQRLRKLQDDYAELSKELNTEIKRNANLNYDYLYADMWRCENGDCKKRVPPKPQLAGVKYDKNIILPVDKNELKK